MAPAVFVVQGAVSKDWKGAVMFAIAIAVGITPEMLPMIVVSISSSSPKPSIVHLSS
jgi:Mg2+-importing ATPase